MKFSKEFLIVFVLLLIMVGVVVLPTLMSGKTFYGIDGNVGVIKNISQGLWKFANEYWNANYLLGLPSGVVFNLSVFLGRIIGYDKVPMFDVALYIVVSFIGMYVFLRSSGLTFWASVFGGVSVSLTTMGILSVLGGHINGSLGFLILALGITKYIYSKDLNLFSLGILIFLVGVSLGLAFADFQRTIYFGIVLGVYIIFLSLTKFNKLSDIFKSDRKTIFRLIVIPILIFLIFVLFSFNSIVGMFGYTQMEQVGVKKDDPESKWRFLVQFSYPPEEILNFFIPGVFGYFSNDPELPYWGRSAQDFDYEKTKQGMRNFRLGMDAYVGVFVLPFIILSLLFFRSWDKDRKKHFIFWTVIAIIAFLFSIARYFPTLFWLLIQIPFFDKMRVPAKWLDIFIISLVIMASISFDSFIRNLGKNSKENRTFLNLLLLYSGVLFISYLLLLGLKVELTMYFNYYQGFDYNLSQKISVNIANSVGNAFLFVFVGSVLLYILETVASKFSDKRLVLDGIFVVFVIVVFVNMFLVVKPLFREVSADNLYSSNQILEFIKNKVRSEQSRVIMYSPLANHYFTFLFPYHDLETIQTIAQSRLPEEYNKILPFINSFSFDIMSKFGVKYFITEIPPTHPALMQIPSIVYYTNLSSHIYLSEQQPNYFHSVYVYEITNSLPRFFVVPNYIKYNGQIELVLMLPIMSLMSSVLITNDMTNFSPSQNLQYNIVVEEYRPDYAKLKLSITDKGFLVFNTFYNPKWECFVNGEKKEIMKANYLVQSVYIDKGGEYDVEFRFNSFSIWALVQLLLLIGFFVAIGYLVFDYFRSVRE